MTRRNRKPLTTKALRDMIKRVQEIFEEESLVDPPNPAYILPSAGGLSNAPADVASTRCPDDSETVSNCPSLESQIDTETEPTQCAEGDEDFDFGKFLEEFHEISKRLPPIDEEEKSDIE